jgi:hypothetical protein
MKYDEISKVTKFAVRKYSVSIPKGMTLDEFCHEVAVFMFLRCKLQKPGAAAIIKNVIWANAELRKQMIRNRVVLRSGRSPDYFAEIDNSDEVDEILDLPTSGTDREILEMLASGLDASEIYSKMGQSRQRYHQATKSLFGKIKLCLT